MQQKSVTGFILEQLTSKQTWKKALYFMGRKSIENAKKPLSKDDIIPLILAFILAIVWLLIIGVVVFRLINLIGF